eukprot:3960353-Lingulodinium_polyedra.AAC.1
MGCPGAVHGQFMHSPCTLHGVRVRRQWAFRGQSIGCHGQSIDSPWATRGLSVGCPGTVHEQSVGNP